MRKSGWLAAFLALLIGAVIGIILTAVASDGPRQPSPPPAPAVTSSAKAVADPMEVMVYDEGSVSCTMYYASMGVVVFDSLPQAGCLPMMGTRTVEVGYNPPSGVKIGVVCAYKDANNFIIVANEGTGTDAGTMCDKLQEEGWSEDPALGSRFNAYLNNR